MEILQLEKTKDNKKLFQQLKVLDFDFIFQKDNDSSRLFYIIEDGKVLGYAIVELAEKACLKKIFINKKLRNNGFGSILLKYIINWLMNNNFDLVMQFPKNESRVLRYGSYYIGINFKSVDGETLFIRYVVDDEELSKQDFNKLTGIINTLYGKLKDYDVEKLNEINKLEN